MNISGTIGDIITITGENLYDSSSSVVYLQGGDSLAEVAPIRGSFSGDESLQFQLPFLPEKNYSIYFKNSASATTLEGVNLIFVGTPKINSLTPDFGTWRSSVRISGENFVHVTGIYLGSEKIKQFNVISENLIDIIIPDGSITEKIKIFATGGRNFSLEGPEYLTVSEPTPTVQQIYPSSSSYGGQILLSGESLHRIKKIHFVGVESDKIIEQFSTVNTTGITVIIPSGAASNQKLILEYLPIFSSERFSRSLVPVILSNKYISSFYPPAGIYGDKISLNGNRLSGAAFFFEGFNTGDITYIPAQNLNVISDEKVEVTVPKNIIKGHVYVSGSALEKSQREFCPLPAITNISKGEFRVGESFVLTGTNLSEVYPVLFISESLNKAVHIISNEKDEQLARDIMDDSYKKRQRYFGEIHSDTSELLSNYPESVITGNAKISGVINSNYLGSGKVFLVSDKEVLSPSFSNSFEGYSLLLNAFSFQFPLGKNRIDDVGKNINISGKPPIILGVSSNRVGETKSVTISGNYFFQVTGLRLSDGYSEGIISIDGPSLQIDTPLFSVDPPYSQISVFKTGSESNYYEYVHSVTVDIKDFNYSGRSGVFSLLSSSYP